MSTIVNDPEDPTEPLAARIALEREVRGWSLADLAERSGVSKAMISKIERGEASPTATLLGAADQPQWQDPDSGYLRRQISPRSDVPVELVRVELPVSAAVDMPAASY